MPASTTLDEEASWDVLAYDHSVGTA
jgi:hypothetical protein